MNSIKTNKGNKPIGQPEGTKKEKNSNPCFCKPKKVAPNTTVKLIKKVKIKWDVEAKLYGIKPIKLFTKINRNNPKMNGKYIWPFFEFIWLITILCILAYIDSSLKTQLLEINLLYLVAKIFITKIITVLIIKYKPKFVKLTPKFTISSFKLKKSFISNWSNGLKTKLLPNILHSLSQIP